MNFLFFLWDRVSVSSSSDSGWAIGALLPDSFCCASSLQEQATTSLAFCWRDSPEDSAPGILRFFRGDWLTRVAVSVVCGMAPSLSSSRVTERYLLRSCNKSINQLALMIQQLIYKF